MIVENTSGPKAEIDIRFIFGSTMGSHQDFRVVTDLFWKGKLKPVIDKVFSLCDGIEAYRRMETGEHFGKILLQP